MCRNHYARFMRNGTFDYVKTPFDRTQDTDTHKRCSKCIDIKPRTEFHRSSRDIDGYRGWCKTCTLASNKAGYEGDRDNVLAKQLERNKTPERQAYIAAYRAAYYETNRDAFAENAGRRRARVRDAFVDAGITLKALRARHGDACVFCGITMTFGPDVPSKYHPTMATLEHMTPLVRGGLHSWDNTRLSCFTCNMTKGRKTPEEYEAYRQSRVAS